MSTNIDFSTEKPKAGKLYGAFKAVSVSAEITESKTDRAGNPYHKMYVDFEYDNGYPVEEGKELPRKRAFFMLPYDYWKDGSNGEPKSAFRQLCDSTIKKLEDFKGDVLKNFVGIDVTILIGANRHWKTGELKVWGDNNDKIDYGIVGFAPFSRAKSAWTSEMEEREQKAIAEFKSKNTHCTEDQAVDPSFGEEESKGEVATANDVAKVFGTEEEAPKKKDW